MNNDGVDGVRTEPSCSTEAEASSAAGTLGLSRRALCLGTGAAIAMLGLGVLKLVPAEAVVRPPGAQDEDTLLGGCIRCERCIEVCPRGVVKAQHVEDGIVGVRTPVMNFDENYCTACYDENKGIPLCAEVCPTSAIGMLEGIDARKIVIGKAVLYTDQCLAYRMAGCRFCYDACPYEAMGLDETNRPYVIADKCNGCGACESVCISLQQGSISAGATHRAIIVEAAEGTGEVL
ncbi:4Fe-4S dicluster domain-containing protein [Adlercreutzia sp. ZJ138]|uniref:4Fe-4S dicluster domain-containing protein n=1 Tax=Adlercreutzia sp. ZJ138 TaxID=2709405 RepID=UPI0013EC9AFD|nr:4Fe-4S dicluster domain-containing protein [Adlercreutzia sp. ZJ138]